MSNDSARRRDARRHQKRGPVQRVLPDDLLADQVRDDRPEALDSARVLRSKSERRQVVRQRIEPHVHDVLRIVGNRNAPLERRAADAEVLKTGFDEAPYLVQAEGGLQKIRVGFVEIEQRLLVLRKAEVIALFLEALDLVAAGRALPVDQLRLGNEDLVDRAIPAFVVPLVDVAVGRHAAPQLLRRTVMSRLRRPDEIVVRDIQVPAHLTEARRDLLGKDLRLEPGFLCGALHFLTVLVGSRQKEHVVAQEPPRTRDRIRHHRGVGVSDVRPSR